MPKTIHQRVTLPAPAESLYDMYLDPRVHEAFTRVAESGRSLPRRSPHILWHSSGTALI